MTSAVIENMRKMVGKYVYIDWHDPYSDWHYFRLLKVNVRKKIILLRGVDCPDGAKHQGDEFWTDWCDVKEIREVLIPI